jgi:hypothetical protein
MSGALEKRTYREIENEIFWSLFFLEEKPAEEKLVVEEHNSQNAEIFNLINLINNYLRQSRMKIEIRWFWIISVCLIFRRPSVYSASGIANIADRECVIFKKKKKQNRFSAVTTGWSRFILILNIGWYWSATILSIYSLTQAA